MSQHPSENMRSALYTGLIMACSSSTAHSDAATARSQGSRGGHALQTLDNGQGIARVGHLLGSDGSFEEHLQPLLDFLEIDHVPGSELRKKHGHQRQRGTS